jgi:hypothetical protein
MTAMIRYSPYLIARAWCERIMLEYKLHQQRFPNPPSQPQSIHLESYPGELNEPFESGRFYIQLADVIGPEYEAHFGRPLKIEPHAQIIISGTSSTQNDYFFVARLESLASVTLIKPRMDLDEAVAVTEKLLQLGGSISHDMTWNDPILPIPTYDL